MTPLYLRREIVGTEQPIRAELVYTLYSSYFSFLNSTNESNRAHILLTHCYR